MTAAAFELIDAALRVAVPDGWEALDVDGRVLVRRPVAGRLAGPSVEVAFRPAGDLEAALEEELGELMLRLTDFTILHVEARRPREANWPDGVREVPFVLAGYRQGLYSLLVEVGVVAATVASAAFAFSISLAEEAATAQEDVDAILEGIEVDWR